MKARFLLIPSLFFCFCINSVSSQVPYRVTNGESLDLDAIATVDNSEALQSFFEINNPELKGCWVHHHPNGTDFVVTPGNWEEKPNSARQKTIHEAMQAITASREAYGVYGSLSSNLYYILDDTRRDLLGEAFWIVNKSCWMISGVPNVSGLPPQRRMQVYAHEIGHCMIMENMQNFSEYYDLNNWFDESVAEYLSSQAYPEVNNEHGRAARFMFSKPFRQPYMAYPLWKYYADREGKKMVFPMMQSLTNSASLNSRRSIMRSTGFDALLHNFYFDFFRGKLIDEDGSIIPANKSTLNITTLNLRPESNKLKIELLHMDKLNGFNIVIPEGYDVDINPLETPLDGVHQSLMQGIDYNVRNWISKKTVKGDCENETSFLVLVSHLNNKPLADVYFDYALRKRDKEECCDDTVEGDCDDCLAPYDAPSAMGPNPVEDIASTFKFDYKINAVVRFDMNMSDVNTEYFRGVPNELVMEYYVNSADGSILFPGGGAGFFNTNFRSRNISDVHATIWLANGQMVTYGYDRDNGRNVAVTRKSRRSAGQRMGMDYQNIMNFFNSSDELAEHPQPMPDYVQWEGITKGYKGRVIESPTGIENTVNLYFAEEPTEIKTSCGMMGFMVGVLKQAQDERCNRLLVYNKVFIGGEGSGDSMEAELRSIAPAGGTFEGRDYHPMYIGGDVGTDVNTTMQDYNRRLQILMSEIENFKERKKLCSDNLCRNQMDREIERLKEQESRLTCEAARALGWEHLADNCD